MELPRNLERKETSETLDAVNQTVDQMKKMREEYYKDAVNWTDDQLATELKTLNEEIQELDQEMVGLHAEFMEAHTEAINLERFASIVSTIIDRRNGKDAYYSEQETLFDPDNSWLDPDDGWHPVYDTSWKGNPNKPERPTRKVDCKRLVEKYNEFDETNGE